MAARTCNGYRDSPTIPTVPVNAGEVLDRFLQTHKDLAPHRALLSQLFHGRKQLEVDLALWNRAM